MPVRNDSLHDVALPDRMPAASAPAHGSASWTGLLVAAMAGTVLLYGIDILFHPLPQTITELFQKFATGSVFFGAAILCVSKGQASPEERLPWWSFALGMALWGTASWYYSAVLWERAEVPYPSLADGFWLAFYPPSYAALYLLTARPRSSAATGQPMSTMPPSV